MSKPFQNEQPTSDLSKFEGLALEEAIDLLKAYMFQKQRAKLEYSELKQWAVCLSCGAKGFVEGEAPRFVNDTTCAKCASQEEAPRPQRTSKRVLSHQKRKA